MNDIDKLNHMIALSQVQLKEPKYDEWFTRGHQKLHIFNIAAKLFVEHDMEPDKAITAAEKFIDTFYCMKVNPKTRK